MVRRKGQNKIDAIGTWEANFKRRYPPTDEVFFVQNAGAPAAGTGLNKSSIVQKISLADAEALRNGSLGAEAVTVHTVPSNPQVINPNGTEKHAHNSM